MGRSRPRPAWIPLCCGALAAALALAGPAPAVAAVRSLTAPYPRTAVWWPTDGHAAQDLARYGLVILTERDRARAEAVKSRDPSRIVLDSTNACELEYRPFEYAANAELRKVPAQWLLTQAGSRLSTLLSATATTVGVEAVVSPDGSKLFAPGSAVVIDDEIAHVLGVSGKTLTLLRGRVKSPAEHPAGARVAAAVSFWGSDLVLDLSTYCPKLVASGSPEPETWGRYNARRGAAMLAAPVWDGLFVDRSDGDESWLVEGSTSATSLDPDRTNRVPADYSAFDAAWNSGLREYERVLRDAAGDGRFVIGNWAHPAYDLLDGNVFEGFPRTDGRSYNGSWRQTAFGPLPGYGGYLEWMSAARPPALGVVASYAYDGPFNGPPAGASSPTDLRKVRFGLATTLLGDGFFAYEVNGSGRGTSELPWFDEYDDAGRRPGHLGRPLGPPRRAVPALTTPDQLGHGGFETSADLAAWEVMTRSGYAATARLDTSLPAEGASSARVDVASALGKGWYAHFTRGAVTPVTAGAEYTVALWAKADRPRTASLWLQGDLDDTRVLADFGEIALDPAWRRIEVSAVAVASSGAAGTRLHVGVGQTTGTVWVDGVRVQKGSKDVWRRDFAGGVVIVNASAESRTIELGDTLRRIRGTQDPAVNDGSFGTSARVPALDGLVLLRPSAAVAERLLSAAADWRRCADRAAVEARDCVSRAASEPARRSAWLAASSRWGAARKAALAARSACAAGASAPPGASTASAVTAVAVSSSAASRAARALAATRAFATAGPAAASRTAARDASAHLADARAVLP